MVETCSSCRHPKDSLTFGFPSTQRKMWLASDIGWKAADNAEDLWCFNGEFVDEGEFSEASIQDSVQRYIGRT